MAIGTRITPNRAGYATIVGPGVTKEFDTLTCGHCGRVYCVAASSKDAQPDAGGMCKICMKMICSPCVGKLVKEGCVPFLKKLELYESKEKLFRDMGLSL